MCPKRAGQGEEMKRVEELSGNFFLLSIFQVVIFWWVFGLFVNLYTTCKSMLMNGKFCQNSYTNIFLKTSTPHSLMTTYRMKLLSSRSISLDSNFNLFFVKSKFVNPFYEGSLWTARHLASPACSTSLSTFL